MPRLALRWPRGHVVVAAEVPTLGKGNAPITAVVTHMDQVGETTLYTDGAAGPEAPPPLEYFPYLHHQTCV